MPSDLAHMCVFYVMDITVKSYSLIANKTALRVVCLELANS